MQKIFEKYYLHLIVFTALFLISIIASIILVYQSSPIYKVEAASDLIQISSRSGMIDSPDITINSSGDTVIVWQDKNGKDYDIYLQLFDVNSNPIGLPQKVNDFGVEDQKNPKVAISESGDFVVVWQSYNQDGMGSGIFGQRFLSNGKKTGSEFRVNDIVLQNQINPDIAMNKDGNFVVAWTTESVNGISRDVFAQFFEADGSKTGEEFKINAYDAGSQDRVSVSIDNFNNVMFAWQGQKDENWDIFARKFNWNGTPWTQQDIQVNTTTEYNQTNPYVTTAGTNKFTVVWESETLHDVLENNLLRNINGQALMANGQKLGSEFRVSVPMFGYQNFPKLAQVSFSEIFVVWENYNKFDKNNWDIFGQKLNTSGVLSGEVLTLNTEDSERNKSPVIASNSSDIRIAWINFNEEQDKNELHYKKQIQF